MITCVISSYKYGHLAERAINSVLSQTVPFDKVFFVDDGVGDCKHLEYPQIEFIHRPKNLGVVANFQDMLNRVQTDKVMFLGADNWIDSTLVEESQKRNEDIFVYPIKIEGELSEEFRNKHGLPEIWKPEYHGSMIYNVSLAKAVGGYERKVGTEHTEEDNVLFHKMKSKGATVFHFDGDIYLHYNRHKDNFNKI